MPDLASHYNSKQSDRLSKISVLLSIVAEIAMAGGSLAIESTPREGSKVTIKIPMEAVE